MDLKKETFYGIKIQIDRFFFFKYIVVIIFQQKNKNVKMSRKKVFILFFNYKKFYWCPASLERHGAPLPKTPSWEALVKRLLLPTCNKHILGRGLFLSM